MKYVFINLFLLFCCGFQVLYAKEATFQIEQRNLLEINRQRSIPIQIYKPESGIAHLPIVVINHGYGVKNTEYSFIAEPLCREGYFVVCIQHDFPEDPELPRTGNLFERRKPIWESGVQNILFVLSEFANIQESLNVQKIILIGHSNGGDISMLFTSLHPELVEKVISLDSLRMPFPIKDHIPILSLRAIDTKADKDVIPEIGAIIIELKNTKHIDMCDSGPEEVKKEIMFFINNFLNIKH